MGRPIKFIPTQPVEKAPIILQSLEPRIFSGESMRALVNAASEITGSRINSKELRELMVSYGYWPKYLEASDKRRHGTNVYNSLNVLSTVNPTSRTDIPYFEKLEQDLARF